MSSTDTDTDIETVELSVLRTRYQDLRLQRPDSVEHLVGSIERHGLLSPLVANRHDDHLELLDGFKRHRALQVLGRHQAPVRCLRLEPTAAMAAIATFNAPHRGLCELEEAWLVRALVRDHGLRQTEIAQLMGRHKSWVCRRLQMAEQLDEHVVDDMRLGLVSATVARELVRLPRGNQPRVAKVVAHQGLTTRQSARLVTRLLDCPDKAARDALLADPLRYLIEPPGRDQPARDARLDARADAVRKQLVALERAALAVAQLSALAVMSGLGHGQRQVIAQRATCALEAVQRAQHALEPLTDATITTAAPEPGPSHATLT